MNVRKFASRGFWLRVAALVLLVSLHLPSAARAQSSTIRFDTLNVEDGLSQSNVRAILQDSRGFVWFGTDDGLNKFDGYTFTIYKNDPENPQSLSDNAVYAIFEDAQGVVWLGTGRGLNRFDRQREVFFPYTNDPSNARSLRGSTVSAITEDARGSLWVATLDGGLNLLDREAGTFTHYQHFPNLSDSLASNMVTALAADPNGGLWVGTDRGLDYFDPDTQRFFHYRSTPGGAGSLSSNRVLALYIDHMSTLWVGTEDGGLNRFNRLQRTFDAYSNQQASSARLHSAQVNAIFEDSQNRLWVGTSQGVFLKEGAPVVFTGYHHDPNDRYSLSSEMVLSIAEDESGVIWIGTAGGGISKHVQSNERFALYQHRPGVAGSLNNDVITAVFEDSQSVVWVGTMDGGLNQLDLASGRAASYEHNPSDSSSLGNNDVRAIYEDQEGTLWVGTYGGGLNRFDRAARRFTRFVYNPSDPRSLNDDRVMSIYEDRRGNLWVGTRSGGLNLMTNRQNGHFLHFKQDPQDPNSLAGDYVPVISEDSRGRLWVGTFSGLSVLDLDTKQFTTYQNDPDNPASLSNNRVLSLYEDSDGVMWVGTLMGGLNRFDYETGTFSHYTEKQGLPNDAVNGILGDAEGNLWLSTNLGLSRFNPRDETFHNYDVRDGLQSNEFLAGSSFQRRLDRLYFGGVQGLNVFNPADVIDNPATPPVVITAFKKFNQVERIDLQDGEEIILTYQDNFISFEFSALDFSTPEKNQYAYMLEGFNREWVYSGNQRNASYTNLKGGEYTFRVIGTNKDGVWNETGTAVRIVVVPPIWERWWFIGSLVVGLVGTVAGGYWLRIRRIQFEQRILEEQVRERTQEIERRRQVAEGLREILAILNSNRTLRESLDWIIQQAVRLTGARAMVIFRNSEGSLPVAVASNLPPAAPGASGEAAEGGAPAPDPRPAGNGAQAAAGGQGMVRRGAVMYMPAWISRRLAGGNPVIVNNLPAYRQAHPELEGHRLELFGALLAVPLWMNDLVDGGLVLLYDRPFDFSNDDLQTAQNFADHAALAIANARLRVQAEEQAVSAERSRLARDLHDAVTQTLFATSLIAEVLPRLWERSPEIGKQKVAEIRELTRGALAEMRTMLMELRPAALEDVALADLLQQLSEAFTGRARVPVQLQADKSIQLPPNVKIGFYRIAQEALNNISKHSRARQVTIHLFEGPQGVQMEIRDDGIGFERGKHSPDHFGLAIMEERAQSIGACYRIESQPGSGTCIHVQWETDENGV